MRSDRGVSQNKNQLSKSKIMKKNYLSAIVAGLLLAGGAVDLILAQDRLRPVGDRPAPTDEERPQQHFRYSGHYAFSVVDTNAPAGTYTAGVGRIKVNHDGIFVMTLLNPSVNATATLTGIVTPRGKLEFIPSLGSNVRTSIRILARGRVVTGVYGRYKIAFGPIIDPIDPVDVDPIDVLDRGDLPAADGAVLVPVGEVDADPITRVPVVTKTGVVIGFRAAGLTRVSDAE
jgi:hypothetical protein